MTLDLPSRLGAGSIGQSFSRGLHWAAGSSLLVATVIAIALGADRPAEVILPAVAALLPIGVLLLLLDTRSTLIRSIGYLAAAAVGSFVFVTVVPGANPLATAPPLVALVLVGGAGSGLVTALAWSTVGLMVAQLVSFVASLGDGVTSLGGWIDPISLIVWMLVVVLLVAKWVWLRPVRRARAGLDEAARSELRYDLRQRAEQRVAALIHDTVLGDLAAIGASTPGQLPAELDAQLRHDLSVLEDGAWLDALGHEHEHTATSHPGIDSGWRGSEVYLAVENARAAGFGVVCSGDVAAISQLSPQVSAALGLAVAQCLSNAMRHSGGLDAELAVHHSGSELLVMVVDTGRGFRETDVPADRLGLRSSVRGRIAAVGGSVQIWSTPGRGTSVILRVPTSEHRRPTKTSSELPSAATSKRNDSPAARLVHVADLTDVTDEVTAEVRNERASILEREVSPFFSEVVERGTIDRDDLRRAGEIAGALRNRMVADADRTWLEAIAEPPGGGSTVPVVIDDDDQLAASMDDTQRTALRALLEALTEAGGLEGSPPEVVVRLEKSGPRCSGRVTATRLRRRRLRRAHTPYLEVMRSAFERLDTDMRGHTLVVRFDYERA